MGEERGGAVTAARLGGEAALTALPRVVGLRVSLVSLAVIARDLARGGYRGTGAWTGVLRQVRRYSDELRAEGRRGRGQVQGGP